MSAKTTTRKTKGGTEVGVPGQLMMWPAAPMTSPDVPVDDSPQRAGGWWVFVLRGGKVPLCGHCLRRQRLAQLDGFERPMFPAICWAVRDDPINPVSEYLCAAGRIALEARG